MGTSPRSQTIHRRNLLLVLTGLLAIACLGFFVEVRNEASRKAQSSMPQGLMTQEGSALGLSGGRARGGSFSAPSGSAGGSIPRSAPGYGNYPSSGGYGGYGGYGGGYYPSYPRGGTVIIPAPTYPGYVPGYPAPANGLGNDIGFLFLLLVLGFMVFPLILNLLKLRGGGGSSGSVGSGERLNDVVTVTQLQVALLAQARTLQSELTELASQANLESQEGLSQLLQETVLALLRSPENWSHARVASQTVRSREQAAQLFEQLSIAERSKFSRETLVNIGGNVRRQTLTPREDADPSAYIVVTLLVGTADDHPLIAKPIYSAEDLRSALQRLGAVSPDYLMVYELLWSPQDAADSLSRDELLASYPNLTQIA